MQIAPASPQKLNQRDTRLSPVWIQLRQYAAGYSATQRAGQRHLRSFIGLRSVHSVVSAEPCSLGNKSTAWVLTWNMKLQGDNYGASNVQESDPMLWCGGGGAVLPLSQVLAQDWMPTQGRRGQLHSLLITSVTVESKGLTSWGVTGLSDSWHGFNV